MTTRTKEMNLRRAREIAYDAKAKELDRRAIRSGLVAIAVDVLESGRAVDHKRDGDRRLAQQLRLFAGMARAE